MLLADFRVHENTTIYKVDVKRRRLEELTPHEGESYFWPVGPWNGGFFMLTDENSEFKFLAFYDLEKREYKPVWKGDWDVEHAAVGKKKLLFSVNEEGFSRLYSLDLEISQPPEETCSSACSRSPRGRPTSTGSTWRRAAEASKG